MIHVHQSHCYSAFNLGAVTVVYGLWAEESYAISKPSLPKCFPFSFPILCLLLDFYCWHQVTLKPQDGGFTRREEPESWSHHWSPSYLGAAQPGMYQQWTLYEYGLNFFYVKTTETGD